MEFERVTLNDLDAIMAIEQAGFNAAEAGSRASYQDRILNLGSNFIVAKDDAGNILGFVCGPAVNDRFVSDEMYENISSNRESGGHQMILTIAISPRFRGQGIGSKLLQQFEKQARQLKRTSIALTCLLDRVPFYEKNGYQNIGISDSIHGNEIWYNMEKIIG
ncbi:GNAT family N-acetyltransferase [Companilactobacillus kimchiensis]|uniref:Acetyltransferase n=1 Tax=Companilactobacillus kimchiensis TaxID=993692 RepID=A0A0R2LBH8_9LACO|nr:GNAT family N-acetyltransferase [Companilactobacillus kimchiensis]KRN99311.1 acetyltransferase [Companilactobacillus kimchiensis]